MVFEGNYAESMGDMNPLHEFKPEIKVSLIVAVIAVILTASGIWLLKSMQPVQVIQTPPPAPTSTAQPQTEILDTSNWQTYRNDEFGFQFDYPDDEWQLRGVYPNGIGYPPVDGGGWQSAARIVSTIVFQRREKENTVGAAPNYSNVSDIIIDILSMEENQTIEEIIIGRLPGLNGCGDPCARSPEEQKEYAISMRGRISMRKLGKHSFYFISQSSYQSAGPHIVYYYLPDLKNKRLLSFWLILKIGYGATSYYEYGLEEEPNYNTLNQVLSTFRFAP